MTYDVDERLEGAHGDDRVVERRPCGGLLER